MPSKGLPGCISNGEYYRQVEIQHILGKSLPNPKTAKLGSHI